MWHCFLVDLSHEIIFCAHGAERLNFYETPMKKSLGTRKTLCFEVIFFVSVAGNVCPEKHICQTDQQKRRRLGGKTSVWKSGFVHRGT